ncbi:MAG: DUF1156 domain-containing protein [Burkholderiales bacterium]|nr:DUF1156 domain-containing protein [Burkholderiales bacterium]
MTKRPILIPGALRDAPALIESVFPAQKVSFEAQRERKAGPGQTLTALGSYWKGRKPLILVRAVLLGSLLPTTEDAEGDLAIFEKLMAFDDEGLARRVLASNTLSPAEIAARIQLDAPWNYFKATIKRSGVTGGDLRWMRFPLNADAEGISLRWQRGLTDDQKLVIYRRVLATYGTYEEKASLGKRPEELDQDWLYANAWADINRYYANLGVSATSLPELVEQLGILRFGHRPRVGDTFSGGGSIPFEAARIGCDVFASDLNPVACMLTWGALNIVGASPERQTEIRRAQREVAEAVDREITALGIEHDEPGNRIKAYIYCIEAKCPETGWMIPLAPSWVISPRQRVIAKLVPNYESRRFEIELKSGVSSDEVAAAQKGTVLDGDMVYELNGKTYRTPIKTLRGDFRKDDGSTANRLRLWDKSDFKPRPEDILQERLYAIQWITKDTLEAGRQETFFAAPSETDLQNERRVEEIIAENLQRWQTDGLVPDMAIEPGYNTEQPIRERGWTHWHHMFSPRDLLKLALLRKHIRQPELVPEFCGTLDFCSKLSRWIVRFSAGGGSDFTSNVFSNQALNTLYNWANRSFFDHCFVQDYKCTPICTSTSIVCAPSNELAEGQDIFITDPPYADAVNYEEITEFFIAWLRKNAPAPFSDWVWDSRRALAIKGAGEDFRRGMVAAYKAMTDQMPDNGMQCVMFTHQDTGVWSDLVGIFWAAGLQVVAAWYIATETTSELKKGGYVQGTVTLMLRKRPVGDRPAFKQRLLPAVRQEVDRQIRTMMHLNTAVKAHHGEPVFNDSDLQMAGYAAALKVLTGYTHIGGEDVTSFALRPRVKGEVTVVDEIVQQAAEAASNLLVPEGLAADTWGKLSGIERFVLRMMDMETTGARKLDNYQNFAKAFRVQDYARVMASMAPNEARLKQATEFASRDLTDSTELGATRLGRLVIALQQMRADLEPQTIISQLQAEMPDFLEARPLLVDLLAFVERKAPEADVRTAAEVLGARLKNQRFGV